ncbi:S-methyl-5-thioribose-1-phosphate isomerase [Sinanaerobacter chloroacetimidivorans]|jgi:methylthioribose-1-phosphate isomerase|uniref:Methylthioribose-1-phosphate isomerase n=1 Tax=Sinanaerobacter chloroacetimidivorans TaxID=2818044 RepID=A0A8J7W6Y3_9FIRM|nr:S-methyl-5-thioribose-1-phosphate isomerase [Sinanaerobacter chloroacetimidivorans]MBR0600213.1 S-methyl-5-thioribose-1-phosphate isomerase [Sinanaerobacter chloroacetimidivorans]
MEILNISPVTFTDGRMLILDQTLLPGETVYQELFTKEDVWDAIYKLKVRGAPAIGVAAGYGLYLSVKDIAADSYEDYYKKFMDVKNYLASSRPTAVNLFWALDRMESALQKFDPKLKKTEEASECKSWEQLFAEIREGLFLEAEKIRLEDEASCRTMGEYGLSLLKPGMGILTHCNAGTIATAKYGTCLAPLYIGQERGYDFKVFADETRPLLQGARLTAWELSQVGIDTTLICDNMASIVMKNGWVDAIVVGCDRMAANGDGANKIGTSGVAILAKEYGIPFYMFVPTSTIDINTKTGKDIHIELREGEEIYKMWYAKSMAPEGIKTYNPAFDVTDAKYITAVITEKGILYPPYEESIAKLFENETRKAE